MAERLPRFGKDSGKPLESGAILRSSSSTPGKRTIPTSVFICETGGMVVICAGTTGYTASVDLRYHWVRQKRLQGSHGSNDEQAAAYNQHWFMMAKSTPVSERSTLSTRLGKHTMTWSWEKQLLATGWRWSVQKNQVLVVGKPHQHSLP